LLQRGRCWCRARAKRSGVVVVHVVAVDEVVVVVVK